MDLPKKINPDSIKEAVIEVKYFSDTPHELLLGTFANAFDDSYTYTNRPLKPQPVQGMVINVGIGISSLLYNNKISIQLLPGSFVLSSLEKYIGWESFQPEVEKALSIIESTKAIKKWVRAGLRYITEYRDKDLNDCIKFSFSFGLPEVTSETTAFHSEFSYQGAKVILNLNNKLPAIAQDSGGQHIIPVSLIDVDVIKDPLEVTGLIELLKVIEELHNTEKMVFFGMLKDDFLHSLNPEY